MRKNGFFGIGCLNMKTETNYGTLFRTAQIFNADFIFLIGKRFSIMPSDTMKSFRHMPLFQYKDFTDFNDHRPYDCPLIGIELKPNAIPLKDFEHPRSCLYLLGAEDNGLSNEAIAKCKSLIVLPGERSLNVAVAGSIVLYDRISKLN